MSEPNNMCPACGKGPLYQRVEQDVSHYKGTTGATPLYLSDCAACGSEMSTATQMRANKRAFIAFKKQGDGLLTGEQVRTLRQRLGISQAEAAQVFGGGPVAFSKYESDDVMQSEAMDKLLRLARDIPAVFEYLKESAGLESNVR